MKDAPYYRIAEGLDKNPTGAPKLGDEFSPAFIALLKILYTPEEAEIIQHLKVFDKFTTIEQVAEITGKDVAEVADIIKQVKGKSGIIGEGGKYCLPPMVRVFNAYHYYPEIKPKDVEAAKLFQNIFIKEGFYKPYESSAKGTPASRSIPIGKAIAKEEKILEAEEAHDLIRNLPTDDLALVSCPCRTRAEKLGIRECKDNNPIGACIMIGRSATHFESIGLGKHVTKEQAIQYLDEMQELGLCVTTDNAVADNLVVCLCCGCCCSMTGGRTRWDNPDTIAPSNFLPESGEECIMCGACVDRCMFDALMLDDEMERAVVDPEKCIGCGVCTLTCPVEVLKLRRYERSQPFPTTGELMKTITIENKG